MYLVIPNMHWKTLADARQVCATRKETRTGTNAPASAYFILVSAASAWATRWYPRSHWWIWNSAFVISFGMHYTCALGTSNPPSKLTHITWEPHKSYLWLALSNYAFDPWKPPDTQPHSSYLELLPFLEKAYEKMSCPRPHLRQRRCSWPVIEPASRQ